MRKLFFCNNLDKAFQNNFYSFILVLSHHTPSLKVAPMFG